MMSDKPVVFGHSWDDIQRAQRGGTLGRPVRYRQPEPEPATAVEHELWNACGRSIEGLTAAGYHGLADRIARGLCVI